MTANVFMVAINKNTLNSGLGAVELSDEWPLSGIGISLTALRR